MNGGSVMLEKENKQAIEFMRAALQESRRAHSFSSPNPHVGAVLVKQNKIISKGHTQPPGKSHAEIQAIKKAGLAVKNSSLYVTLEPCSIFGRTPPCTEQIIKSGIKNVYIGMKDPNPKVSGKGARLLKKAGIQVYAGLLKKEIEEDLQWYIKYCQKKTPYIILKSGVSLDGKITDSHLNSKWITSINARNKSVALRNINDGIIVGIDTVLADNPSLTSRKPDKKKENFYRIILDSKLRISPSAKAFSRMPRHKTILVTSIKNKKSAKIKALNKKAELLFCKTCVSGIDLNHLLRQLGNIGITRAIVEGGGKVNYSFLENNLVDKIVLYISGKLLGGANSKGWIGGQGFELGKNKKIEKGKFTNILSDNFMFEGYMKYYVYRNN